MMGYSGLARKTLPAGSTALPYLEEVGRAAARASELTHQLLAYSGKGKLVVEALPLDALVHEMHGLLQTVVSKKAVTRLDLKPATVEADAAQIRQVVMNLITNASDALSSRPGEIAVSTGVREMTEEAILSPYLKQPLSGGRYAFLEVSDTGIGMDEATVGRIFDPFFTTKGPGRGLGLAAALGIVHGHRGSLQVSSIPGKGSTFRVFLPAAEAGKSRAAEAAGRPAGEKGALLLVVDDEASVRNFMKTALESADYRVMAACDGQEGLEVFAANRREIRAVILDLTMPRMDGWEVLARLRAIDPDLPVVLTSGYTEPALPVSLTDGKAPPFVQKPFVLETLLESVTGAISKRRP
jgi:CheY-like chemotaxis protein